MKFKKYTKKEKFTYIIYFQSCIFFPTKSPQTSAHVHDLGDADHRPSVAWRATHMRLPLSPASPCPHTRTLTTVRGWRASVPALGVRSRHAVRRGRLSCLPFPCALGDNGSVWVQGQERWETPRDRTDPVLSPARLSCRKVRPWRQAVSARPRTPGLVRAAAAH